MKKILKNDKFKRLGAVFMAVCLMMSLFCVGVSAADTDITDLAGTQWRIDTVTFSGDVIRIFSDTPICSVTPSGGQAFEAYSIHLGTVYGGSSSDNSASYYGEEGEGGASFVSGDTVTFYESTASTNANLISFMEASATLLNDSEEEFNPVYGHYISPGEYVFSNNISVSAFPSSASLFFDVPFKSGSDVYSQIQVYISDSNTFQLIYIPPVVSSVYKSYDGGWVDDSYRYITITEGFYIYDFSFYQFWISNVTRVSPGYDSNLLDGFLSAFTMIGQWISGAANTLTSMFWSNSSLTFLGTLAVAGLALAVSFLIIGLIQRFLKFRG